MNEFAQRRQSNTVLGGVAVLPPIDGMGLMLFVEEVKADVRRNGSTLSVQCCNHFWRGCGDCPV